MQPAACARGLRSLHRYLAILRGVGETLPNDRPQHCQFIVPTPLWNACGLPPLFSPVAVRVSVTRAVSSPQKQLGVMLTTSPAVNAPKPATVWTRQETWARGANADTRTAASEVGPSPWQVMRTTAV
jgi:hypothetical protein